jgi:hypothetical protein
MKNIDLHASELVMELEALDHYGLGYFAGVLVERRRTLAEELVIAIELNKEGLDHEGL